MSILDNEEKIFDNITDSVLTILPEDNHIIDYHQAWWDMIKSAMNDYRFSRIDLANIFFTYQSNYWNYEATGMGTVEVENNKCVNYVITGNQPTEEDDRRLVALKAYIALLISGKNIDSDLLNDSSKFSMTYNIFKIKWINKFYILYNRGEFRKDYIMNNKVIESRYKLYIEQIKLILKHKKIKIPKFKNI